MGSRRRKLLFALVPLLVLAALGEVGTRLYRDPLHLGSFRALRLDRSRRGTPSVTHPRLGYAPRPGYAGSDNLWGTQVTIDAEGVRSNGQPPPAGDRLLVAVGDSFTFGDQVDDHETWPAELERILGRRVVNGGVFGYSLAQTVLRAEELLERHAAEWLVLSFIPDDLERCEYSKRWAPMPWFEIVDGRLVLRNVPVADPSGPDTIRLRGLKNALGYSALLDAILANTVRDWWYLDERRVRALPPGDGARVGLLLVDRAVGLCRERDCRLLVVLQGKESAPEAVALLDRAREAGAASLDLIAAVEEEAATDPTVRLRLFDGHMTAEGNRWAARRIAAALR